MEQKHELKINDVFVTDPSLDHFWQRAKAKLPITDVNELYVLLSIHKNTIIHEIGNTHEQPK